MIQGREHARLALETGETLRVARERAREDLDRDVAPKVGVLRAIHLAHATLAEQLLKAIAANGSPRQVSGTRFAEQPNIVWDTRPLRKCFIRNRLLEQSNDFVSQDVILGTLLGNERGALVLRPLHRGVVQLLDPLPALRPHSMKILRTATR